jgi:hypothetical protein
LSSCSTRLPARIPHVTARTGVGEGRLQMIDRDLSRRARLRNRWSLQERQESQRANLRALQNGYEDVGA